METGPQILLSGASGLIGRELQLHFRSAGVPYATLVRHTGANSSSFFWDPYRFEFREDMRRLDGVRAAIHLSGENVASGRWTAAKMRRLRDSRIRTTESLVELLRRLDPSPEVLICASGVNFYGDRGEEVLDESSCSGTGFLAGLCREWEAAAEEAARFGVRVISLRLGAVLAADGGALAKMLPFFRLGLGGHLGNGRQWMSWISLPDVVRIVDFCMKRTDLRGPVNTVANPVTNSEFSRALGVHLHRPAFLAMPAFAAQLALGKIADEALLASTRAIPAQLLRSGFVFQQPTLQDAFQKILPN